MAFPGEKRREVFIQLRGDLAAFVHLDDGAQRGTAAPKKGVILEHPVYHAIITANVNDVNAAKDMPIEAGMTYVFDLGYYDYAWWAKLDAQGCRMRSEIRRPTLMRPLISGSVSPSAEAASSRASSKIPALF